jgi:hypothetical protein
MTTYEYPPAVRVHGIDCIDVKNKAFTRLPLAQIAATYPNGSPHLSCLSFGHREGVIEVVDYPDHPYEESSQHPADATRPLCAYCSGTHGVADQLLLPPGVARNLPSTRHR